MGVVEAVNGNIKALLRRGRGYRDLNYLLLKAQCLAAKHRVRRFPERRVECALLQILVQNPIRTKRDASLWSCVYSDRMRAVDFYSN
jgi:hypothetical protein